MGMGLAGLGTASGAAQGLQEILAQRLRERQMALQEQAQRESVELRRRELEMRQQEVEAERASTDEYRQDVLATQAQTQRGMAVDRAARQTPYQFKLARPQAETFKAYGYPVNENISQEQLNSPLANEALEPDEYTYGGNAPTPRAPGSPVKIRGLNGKPVFANPEDAIGKEAWDDPGQASGGGGSALTPGGLDVAATQYASTGQMPPLGMGSSSMRAAIINRAAELFPNLNIAASAGSYRANVGSLSQMTKRYNAVQAYANQAKLSLQNAARLSGNVARSGSPMVNRYRNWANKNLKGSAPLSEFEVFVYTAARDYARVTSGGAESVAQMTDAATEAADVLLNSAQTPEAFAASLKAMQADMDNVTSTIRDQIVNLKTDVGAKPGQAQSEPAQTPAVNPKDPLGIR